MEDNHVKRIIITDQEYDLLLEKLYDHDDEGPPGEGWKSEEFLVLISKIEFSGG